MYIKTVNPNASQTVNPTGNKKPLCNFVFKLCICYLCIYVSDALK